MKASTLIVYHLKSDFPFKLYVDKGPMGQKENIYKKLN